MEAEAVVKAAAGQIDKIGNGLRRNIRPQYELHLATVGGDDGDQGFCLRQSQP